MSNYNIIRAWKDENYRSSLSDEQLSQLPGNPAGEIELSDAEMQFVAGGQNTIGDKPPNTFICTVPRFACPIAETALCGYE
jgi:mersacidin/lichenicidin family type 2 lantibiotic